MPTFAPSRASASARLTAVVDLPTPPLPDATATMFFTPRHIRAGAQRRCVVPQRQLDARANGGAESLRQIVLQAFGRITEHDVDLHRVTALFDTPQRSERLPRGPEVRVREPIQRFDGRHDEINPGLSERAL